MTFDEWWAKARTYWEFPESGAVYVLLKVLTSAAWKSGHREGSMETVRFMTAARKEEEEEG